MTAKQLTEFKKLMNKKDRTPEEQARYVALRELASDEFERTTNH